MFRTGVGVRRMEVPLRLSSTSASRKFIALEFIKRTIVQRGVGPSLREIGAYLGNISNSRVHEIVAKLVQEGYILKQPGVAYGISLPDIAENLSESDIIRRARQLGYDLRRVFNGPSSELPMPPMLDHIPDIDIGGNDDDIHRKAC
jgi:hypothetical protein